MTISRARWLQAALLLAAFTPLFLQVYGAFVDIGTNSVDGKFQTYGAVQLLNTAYEPFSDYPVYLGLWVVRLVAAASLLFGDTVLAVQQTAIVLTGLAFPALIIVLFLGVGLRPRYWPHGLAAIMLAANALGLIGMRDFVSPGNSLLLLRAMAVVVAGAVVFGVVSTLGRHRRRALLQAMIWGMTAGFLLLWSNDFGLASAVALLLTLIFWVRQDRPLIDLPVGVAAFLVTAWATLALMLALHGVGLADWFDSNFIATAGDQFWLFGPWEEARHAFTLPDVVMTAIGLRSLSIDAPFSLIIFAAALSASALLLLLLFRRRAPGAGETTLVVLVLAAWTGAMIATVGGHFDKRYWLPLVAVAPFAVLVVVRAAGEAFEGRWGLKWPAVWAVPPRFLAAPLSAATALAASDQVFSPQAPRLGVWKQVGAAAALIVAVAAVEAAALQAAARWTRLPGVIAEAADLGGWRAGLAPANAQDHQVLGRIRAVLDRCAVPSDRRVLEAYPSLVGAHLGAAAGPDRVSIIHVLGQKARDRYAAAATHGGPVLATTLAEGYADWAHWNVRARWFWYKPLIRGYRPVARTDHQVLWVRGGGAAAATETPGVCRVTRLSRDVQGLTLIAPPGAGAWGRITVSYASRGEGAGLTRTLRTLVIARETRTRRPAPDRADYFYGIPPEAEGETLIFQRAGPLSEIRLEATPAGAASLDVSACSVSFFDMPDMTSLPRVSRTSGLVETVEAAVCPVRDGVTAP